MKQEIKVKEDPEYVRRGMERAQLTQFLMTHLFGWTSVKYENEGHGVERTSRTGRVAEKTYVKGWYGINPQTKRYQLFSHQIAHELGSSRRVVEAMEQGGYGFLLTKAPNREWEARFILLSDQRADFIARDEQEATAICKAARMALEADPRAIGKVPAKVHPKSVGIRGGRSSEN